MSRQTIQNAWRPGLALMVLCLGTFATLLDTTIVNVALPSIITGLHASLDQALWMINAYLLVFSSLLILAGRLGDLLGPRRMFTAGLALFAIASAACGAAQSPDQLVAARVVQGVGAAALSPQAMTIIRHVFPRERMGAAFGVFSSMISVAAVSGPTLGGLLTTYLSWRWVFYVNLPIAAAGIVLAYLFVPEVRTGRRLRLDVTGVVLASAGLFAVCYGVIEGQRYDWGTVAADITIPEIIIMGVVLLAVFAVWERRQPEPLLPGSLFASRTFTIMAVLSLLVQFALQSMLLAQTLNYQSALGFTAVRAGLTGLPLTIAMIILAPLAGRMTDRVGGKWLLMTGLVTYAAGILGVAIVASPTATSLTFTLPLTIAGVGMAAIFAPVNTMGMRAAPPALAGAASGVINTGRQLGATIGAAVTGAVLATQLAAGLRSRALIAARHLPDPEQRPFTSGFAAAARSGLQVGRGQPAARIPAGLRRAQIPYLEHLVHDVFARAYIAALHYALAVPVAVLIAGAIGSLLLRRGPAPDGSPIGRPTADTTALTGPTPRGRDHDRTAGTALGSPLGAADRTSRTRYEARPPSRDGRTRGRGRSGRPRLPPPPGPRLHRPGLPDQRRNRHC